MKKAKRETNCWVWPYATRKDGYGILQVQNKVIDAHRFMYELLKGKVPNGCELDHLCSNRLCTNPEHLEPVSHAVNCRRGKSAKLTEQDVIEVRGLSKIMSQRQISEKYNVSRQTIGYILQGKTWKENNEQ